MITIQEPTVELMIMERLRAGSFETVEQTLLDALTQAPPARPRLNQAPGPTGEEIIACFQRCPDKDFEFGAEQFHSRVSEPVEF